MNLTYRSSYARLSRTLFFALIGMFLYGLNEFFWLHEEGALTLGNALLIGSLAVIPFAIRLLNNSVIVEISEVSLSLQNGFRLIGAKPLTIPLERIHTLQIVSDRWSYDFRPLTLTLAYRWPEKKMLHATTTIPVATIPNAAELILEVARRTKGTIKLYSRGLDSSTVTLEELEGMQEKESS